MKIDPEKFYTPKEIIDTGILSESKKFKASTYDTKRQMLLRFIRENRIESINVGGKKSPRYVVQGKFIVEFNNKLKK